MRVGGRIGCHDGSVNRGKNIGLRGFIAQIDAADAGQIFIAVDDGCDLAFSHRQPCILLYGICNRQRQPVIVSHDTQIFGCQIAIVIVRTAIFNKGNAALLQIVEYFKRVWRMVGKIEGGNGVGGFGSGNGNGDGSAVFAVRNIDRCGSVRMCGDFTGCFFDAHNVRAVGNPLQGTGGSPEAASDRKLIGCSRLHSQCPFLRQKIIVCCDLRENFHFGQRNGVFAGGTFCHLRCGYFYITRVCDLVKKKLPVLQCTLVCNLIIGASVCRYGERKSCQFSDLFGTAVLQTNTVHRVGAG
ncbi:unknown [Clostridium sp. CAG:448]|nr:unknown [Clostridium sp. CAG:448]